MSDPVSESVSHPWISSIRIRHFAGVEPESAFAVEDFCPGINLIHGPNGSGKTTTANALQELLWNEQDSDDYRLMEAALQLGTHSWTLSWNAIRPEVISEEGSPPPRLSPELRNRYFWSLRDLLQATDGDLAARIAREMAGGVDFDQLEILSGGGKIPPFPRKLHDQYEKAAARAREIVKTQARLQHRSERLEHLQQERTQLEEQHARIPMLTRLMELRDHEAELDSLQEQLKEFPAELADANREDANRIDQIEAGLTDAGQQLRETTEQIRQLGRGEEAWALFPAERIREIRKTMQRALTLLGERLEEERVLIRNLEQQEIAEQELRRRLRLQDDQAERLLREGMIPELRDWIQLVIRENRISEELQSLEARLKDLPTPSEDPEILRDAERDLRTWLTSVERPRSSTLAGFAATYLLWCVLLGVLARNATAWWLSLLPVPFLVEWICLRLFGNRTRQSIQSRYPAEVIQPEIWEEAAVRQTLEQLEAKLGEMRTYASFEPDRNRQETLNEQYKSVNASVTSLMGRLWDAELTPDLTPEWAGLFLLDVKEWRDVRIHLAQAEQQVEEARSLRSDQEQAVLTIYQEWSLLPAGNSIEDHGRDLLQRLEQEQERRERLDHLRSRETLQRERSQELEQEQTQLCERLGVNPGDWSGARARIQRLEAYLPLKEKRDLRERQIEEGRAACVDAGEWLEQSREELEEERSLGEQAGAESRALEKEIQEILAEIRQATRGRELHEIREHQDDLREQLLVERDRILHTRLVQTVVDWLREQCRTGRRPEVLDAANAHLSRMTQGALQLTLSLEKGVEEFRAAAPGHPARSLDHLSAGERTHVLMAVRLAFLQHQEITPFPLFVDEVLGTSDDQRTRAILRTLVESARQGRQIFAFTAETEEVAKWQQVLEDTSDTEAPVPFQVIDLGAIRYGSPAKPVMVPEPALQNIQRLSGESDGDWAHRLGIPAWTPHQPLEDLPLFLILQQDEDTLIQCLQAGIRTWGALEKVLETGSSVVLTESSRRDHLLAKVAALRALQAAWQVGRPAPLNPQTLVDSGIVSANLLPAVLEVLNEQNGQIPLFLEALEAGSVPQWGKKKTDRLKEFLQEEGYMPSVPPLSLDTLRAQAMEDMSKQEESSLLAPSDWGQLTAILDV